MNDSTLVRWDKSLSIRLVPFHSRYGAIQSNADEILAVARQAAQDGIDAVVFPRDALPGGNPSDPFFARPAVQKVLAEQRARLADAAAATRLRLLGFDDTRIDGIQILPCDRPFAYPAPADGFADSVPVGSIQVGRLALDGRDGTLVHPGGAVLRDAVHGAVRTPLFDARPIDVHLERDAVGNPVFHVLSHPTHPVPATGPLHDLSDLWSALVFALRDYVENNRFRGILVALSGGIDSALVATLAADAIGPGRVMGVTMPSVITSGETLGDAVELARRLAIPCLRIPIAPAVDTLQAGLSGAIAAAVGDWPGSEMPPPLPQSLMAENLQARIRGTYVMSLSNLYGHLVLATSNRSESLTGYSTLYGDMCGGYAPIKDVAKTDVFALARWRNALAASQAGPAGVETIPPSTIERPPSAELRENQKDSDSLPPYDVLDPLLDAWVDRATPCAELPGDRATAVRVRNLVLRSEYKRRQAAPGPLFHPAAAPLPLFTGFTD